MISSHTCKIKCNDKISQEKREAIHTQFWELEENERKVYVLGHINKSTLGGEQLKISHEEDRNLHII